MGLKDTVQVKQEKPTCYDSVSVERPLIAEVRGKDLVLMGMRLL